MVANAAVICYNIYISPFKECNYIMKTLFKNCDIVTTTDSGFEVIRNGFCGVDGAYICYLGTDKPAEKYDIIKDMTGKVLYPGLINAHNHAAMTLLRGIGSVPSESS